MTYIQVEETRGVIHTLLTGFVPIGPGRVIQCCQGDIISAENVFESLHMNEFTGAFFYLFSSLKYVYLTNMINSCKLFLPPPKKKRTTIANNIIWRCSAIRITEIIFYINNLWREIVVFAYQ